MSRRFRIIFSLSCAVLAALLCLNYADHVQNEAQRARAEVLERYGGEVVTLVVTTAALEPGDVATQANVTTREWLVDLAPEGALTSLDDVVGREVGNAAPKGVPLTEVTFRDSSTMAEVPAGRVAVTVPVTDKLGIAHDVSQGATLAAYEVTTEGTKLLSPSLVVLAVPVTTGVGTSSQLTVAVLPDDVPAILTASATNDLRLVMPGADPEKQNDAESAETNKGEVQKGDKAEKDAS